MKTGMISFSVTDRLYLFLESFRRHIEYGCARTAADGTIVAEDNNKHTDMPGGPEKKKLQRNTADIENPARD